MCSSPAPELLPHASAESAVAASLDALGRRLPPAAFRWVLQALRDPARRGQPAHPAGELGFGITFVLDSCSLQRVLRFSLKGGRSGVLEGMRAGFLRFIAPRQLDEEIRKHLDDIAADCRVPSAAARALYTEVASLIEFRAVSPDSVARLRREMPNTEDAAFIAVLRESDAVGLVTEEKAYAEIPGIRVYRVAETPQFVLCFRKQAVVWVCSLTPLCIASSLAADVLRASAALARKHPHAVAIVGLAALAVACVYPAKTRRLIEGARSKGA